MFRLRPKYLVYFLIFFIPFYILVSRNRALNPVKYQLFDMAEQPIRWFSWPMYELKKIFYYHQTFDEYKKAKAEAAQLRNRLIGLEEVVRQNARYEQLLEFKRQLAYSTVAANVIGREPSQWNSTLIIDKGAKDGIKIGFAVVDASGVVGKIVEVGPSKSKVIALTDPQFSIAAIIQESRGSGLVSGTLQGYCRLRYLSGNTEVKVGDKVITSKLSSLFPEGLFIGTVIKVSDNSFGNSPEYLIDPAVSMSEIEEVLVITK